MSADIAHELHRNEEERTLTQSRARVVLTLGPVTAFAGVIWAIVQPWRLTLLHPHGQGFWWLVAEPPLYVVLVGVLFRVVIARGLVADIEETE
ncbi:MAG TPA: hypothetical protein VGN06_01750 [Gaiellaceae bacterium]|jgi:hypothetical protein